VPANYGCHIGESLLAIWMSRNFSRDGTTGIAIAARVFGRLHQKDSREARVIFGAAVVDDVLGLVMLAIATGIAVTGSAAIGDIGRTAAHAGLFIACAFGLGPSFIRFLIWLLGRFNVLEAKLFVSFILVMVFAGLASLIYLSPAVGGVCRRSADA